MAKFFVSYSRSVKDEVRKVIELLIAGGHEVWWDGDIPVMADWWATILDKIEWCEVFIFVASEKSVQSAYCLAELKYASDRQRPILPFMLEDPATLTLPVTLPSRGQWLLYNGDPAQMLTQINTACDSINWALHRDIKVRRPSEPSTGGKSLAKQFQAARRLANDKKFEEAKTVFGNIKRLDYGKWGMECDEWLGRLNNYVMIMELADDESTTSRARTAWAMHSRQYGKEFDPHDIEQKLRGIPSTKSRLPYVAVVTGALVIGVLIIGVLIASSSGGTDTPTLTDDETRVALVDTETPTDDPTPTATPISSSDIQQTAQAEILATETSAALGTQNAVLTEQFSAGATATYIAQLSLTPPATNTPTATSSPTATSIPDPLQAAFTPVTRNADWAPYEREFDGVTMMLVPVGSFEMGSTEEEIVIAVELCSEARQDDEVCYEYFFDDETPVNIQEFSEPFWIDRTEVTRGQYAICVEASVCEETPDSPYSTEDNQPIISVTWFQAQTYCEEWRDGRLPTEAEWEYTARGPDRLLFPWGNEFDYRLANHCDINCAEADWASNFTYTNPDNNDVFEFTAPVASFEDGVSWVGAHDMAGNLWEWTSSLYRDYPYNEDHESTINSDLRVMRGGSFAFGTAFDLRSTDRAGYDPNFVGGSVGFRCARSHE